METKENNIQKTYTLMGADGRLYESKVPGTFGGNRKAKIYGRLDCHAALRAIPIGGYEKERVFFAEEETAIAAGFRPCGACLREKYRIWKSQQ